MTSNLTENVVLIGAGSVSFTRGLIADILRKEWTCRLSLVDVDAEALQFAEGLARKMIEARRAPVELTASTDRRDVLHGATVVICTIGVGGRRAWEQDVFVPREFGIYQPVGDSVMPGGTSRALRMIPAMVDVARDVLDLAPDALFFNYGNPMAPVCRAVRKATGANVVGLCHGVFDVGKHLAGLVGAAPERVRYTAVGMNHLTWFTELRVDGKDAMPKLRQIAREKVAELRRGAETTAVSKHQIDDPFTWELTDLFGAFPAVLDRHVTEFFPHLFRGPGSYYGRTLGVEAFSFEGTIAGGDQQFDEMREVAMSPDPLPNDYFDRMSGEHEQVIDIIESIRGDRGIIYSANLPNRGQAPNLPEDAIVESPVVAEGSGLRPLLQPPLAPGLAATLATRFQWVETVADAALEGSRSKFIQALLVDGAVMSVDEATRLADALLAAQTEHLPQFA